MKIFLSWSGDESKRTAKLLKSWLLLIFPTLDVWVSSEDISAGERWAKELFDRLENTEFGILCITKENSASPWLLYEAGALSKSIDSGRIVPFVTGIEFSQLPGPLTHFQAVHSDEAGARKLIQAISAVLPNNHRSDSAIDKLFELLWPELKTNLDDTEYEDGSELSQDGTPTVTFLFSEGLNILIGDARIKLSEKEYLLYLFVSHRASNGEASYPYYKAVGSEFREWLKLYSEYLPDSASRSWLHEIENYRPDKTMSSVFSSLRKKIRAAGFQELEEHLLPTKGRIGVNVILETDLFDQKRT